MPALVLVTSCLVVLLSSCGGPRPRGETDGEDRSVLSLGPPVTIPGSGVSFEPPPGAEILPLGPGVEVAELEMTIVVAIAEGDAATREAFRGSLFLEGSSARTNELHLADDGPATIGRDVLPSPVGAVARVWLIAERGRRTLALLATYRDASDPRVEALAAASLASVSWDADREISPSEAIGLALGPAPGMSLDRSSLGTVALTEAGAPFPPPMGDAMAFLLPLTEPVPAERSVATCAAILDRAGAITEAPTPARAVEGGSGWGCERSGTHRTPDGGELFAHGAVVFLPPGPVLLTAMVDPARREEWAPRFAALSPTIRYLRGE